MNKPFERSETFKSDNIIANGTELNPKEIGYIEVRNREKGLIGDDDDVITCLRDDVASACTLLDRDSGSGKPPTLFLHTERASGLMKVLLEFMEEQEAGFEGYWYARFRPRLLRENYQEL